MLTALDQIANQTHLQMIKAMLPYLPANRQKTLSLVIKFQELQNVAQYFRRSPMQLKSCSSDHTPVHLPDMLNDIRNYCDENEKKMIDQISNLFSTIELYSAMAETMSPESFMTSGFPFGDPKTDPDTSPKTSEEPNPHAS